jgi:hypothetical protein
MEEGIARPIEEFDEAKSLLGTEPFDYAAEGGPERGLEPGLAESGSGAEYASLSVLGVSVEFATPRMAEISRSHFGSWRRDPDDSCSVTGSAEVLV